MPQENPTQAPFPLPLRAQASGSDARAERLIRQIRTEVEDLRQTLSDITEAQDEMLVVDLSTVVADPEAAASLPATVLVRGLLVAAGEQDRLRSQVADQAHAMTDLVSTIHDLREQQSYYSGRQETLDQVIGALHANLGDFRSERDYRAGVSNGSRPALSAAEARPKGYVAEAVVEHE